MAMDSSKELNQYIREISNHSGVNELLVRNIIDTQIDKFLSDIAVQGYSELYFGKAVKSVETGKLNIRPGKLINDLAEGKIDKEYLLLKLQNK